LWKVSASSHSLALRCDTIEMAAPLSVCTKEKQRGVIRFLWSEGETGAEIHRRLSAQYGDRALPRRSVYEFEYCNLNLTPRLIVVRCSVVA